MPSDGPEAAPNFRPASSLAGWGLLLPHSGPSHEPVPPLLASATLAEELGFDSGWIGDHLAFHVPYLEATCAMAAVAARTTRLRLGFGVLQLGLRHPVWAAKQLGTLACLAPGRLVLGVGVGGENPEESAALGIAPGRRGRLLDEALDVVGSLLRGEGVEHRGPLLEIHSPPVPPVPGHMLPLVVGGRSEVARARAARRADGWLGMWLSPARVAAAAGAIAEEATALGRPVPEVLMAVFVNVCDDTRAGQRDAGSYLAERYHLPVEEPERWCVIGSTEEVAAVLAGYRAVGVRGFVLVPTGAHPFGQIERLAQVRELLEGPGQSAACAQVQVGPRK